MALSAARAHDQWRVEVSDQSGVSEARRQVAQATERLGFGETEQGRAAIVVTEAATNLWKHARGGEIVVRERDDAGVGVIEILALDRGPGMARVAECMKDGFSTAGTAGNGLGAIARLSSEFDIISHPGSGTALWSTLRGTAVPERRQAVIVTGGVCLPVASEEECGDAWSVLQRASGCRIVVADGLGHGPDAARASRAALLAIAAAPNRGPAEALDEAHGPLRSTRGAAVAIADVDVDRGVVQFAGIGNVAAVVVRGGTNRHLLSTNGTVGLGRVKGRQVAEPWDRDATLVLYSDGLATKWALDAYPALAGRQASLIAGVLYRDHTRGRDDVTVVVARGA